VAGAFTLAFPKPFIDSIIRKTQQNFPTQYFISTLYSLSFEPLRKSPHRRVAFSSSFVSGILPGNKVELKFFCFFELLILKYLPVDLIVDCFSTIISCVANWCFRLGL
jgi:hypothetical protein